MGLKNFSWRSFVQLGNSESALSLIIRFSFSFVLSDTGAPGIPVYSETVEESSAKSVRRGGGRLGRKAGPAAGAGRAAGAARTETGAAAGARTETGAEVVEFDFIINKFFKFTKFLPSHFYLSSSSSLFVFSFSFSFGKFFNINVN